MTPDRDVTRILATFATDTDAEQVDASVRRAVRRAVLDSIGVTIAGASHAASRVVVDMIRELDAVRDEEATAHQGVTVVGFAHRTDPQNAALANGVMAHVLDWDDTLLPTRLHLSATLLPALLAVGEARRWSGADVTTAFAIGFEIQARLAEAISPEMPERGWHGTGIVGGAGVAAALTRGMGLDVNAAAHAIGIAATGGAGLVSTFGSMSKALNLGRAGALGVQSAFLASRGFTSHPDIIGAGGFLRMFADQPRTAGLVDDLGARWAVLDNGYKPYPCGVVAHAAIDGVRELRREAGAAPGARLRLIVSPETVRLMGNPEPSTGLEAKFSVRYAAAVAWVDGEVLPAAFEDTTVLDPRYRAAMAGVEVESRPDVAQDESIVELDLGNDQSRTIHVEHARGTRARPMTDDELAAKFRAACEVGNIPHADRLLATIAHIDEFPVSALTELLTGLRR